MKILLAVAVLALMGRTAMAAEEWGNFAIISDTLGVSADRLCVGEGTRGELGCPSYAPYVSSTTGYVGIATTTPSVTFTVSGSTFSSDLILKSVAGNAPVSNTVTSGGGATALSGLSDVTLSGSTTGDLLYYNGSAWVNQASSGLFSSDRITSGTHVVTVNTASGYVSLSTGGTDWGYLASGASYLPRLNFAGISATTNQTSLTTLYASGHSSLSTVSATYLSGDGAEITSISNTLALLKDVSMSSPADNSLLRYNNSSSKWEAVGINDGVSTTTMTPNRPDAIFCTVGDQELSLYRANRAISSDAVAYDIPYSSGATRYYVAFDSSNNYTGNGNMATSDCVTSAKSIATLYAEGKAFNFLGNNGSSDPSSALGDRITSGTTYVLASENSSVTIRTGGTDRMIVGEAGDVGIATSTPAATLDVSGTVKVAGTGAESCSPATYGTFRRNPSTGRMQICRY